MKAKSLSLCLMLAVMTAFGQGTFNFSNRVPSKGIDAPVFHLDGTRLAGSQYLAQLYLGMTGESREPFKRVSDPVAFGIGDNAGYWGVDEDLTRTVDWIAPGQEARAQVRVWNVNGGETFETVVASGRNDIAAGLSDTLMLKAGAPESPTFLRNLEGFFVYPASMIPENSVLSLTLFGVALIVLFRR